MNRGGQGDLASSLLKRRQKATTETTETAQGYPHQDGGGDQPAIGSGNPNGLQLLASEDVVKDVIQNKATLRLEVKPYEGEHDQHSTLSQEEFDNRFIENLVKVMPDIAKSVIEYAMKSAENSQKIKYYVEQLEQAGYSPRRIQRMLNLQNSIDEVEAIYEIGQPQLKAIEKGSDTTVRSSGEVKHGIVNAGVVVDKHAPEDKKPEADEVREPFKPNEEGGISDETEAGEESEKLKKLKNVKRVLGNFAMTRKIQTAAAVGLFVVAGLGLGNQLWPSSEDQPTNIAEQSSTYEIAGGSLQIDIADFGTEQSIYGWSLDFIGDENTYEDVVKGIIEFRGAHSIDCNFGDGSIVDGQVDLKNLDLKSCSLSGIKPFTDIGWNINRDLKTDAEKTKAVEELKQSIIDQYGEGAKADLDKIQKQIDDYNSNKKPDLFEWMRYSSVAALASPINSTHNTSNALDKQEDKTGYTLLENALLAHFGVENVLFDGVSIAESDIAPIHRNNISNTIANAVLGPMPEKVEKMRNINKDSRGLVLNEDSLVLHPSASDEGPIIGTWEKVAGEGVKA